MNTPRHDHGSMDMNNMDMSSGNSSSSMGSMIMSMVFQTQRATPLYSNDWTPKSDGAYAGTCIFLIALSIGARLLVAFRHAQEQRWKRTDSRRRYIAVQGKGPLAERIASDPDAKVQVVLSENGVEETVYVVAASDGHEATKPWRFSVDPFRALLDTAIVGVGYLL